MTGTGLSLLGCDEVGADAPSLDDVRAGRGVLKKGSKGQAVAELQKALGVDPADGDFGPKTHEAVRAFQRSNGLNDDGVVGKDTAGAMAGATPVSRVTFSESDADPVAVKAPARAAAPAARGVAAAPSEKEVKGAGVGTYAAYGLGGLALLFGGYALWPKKSGG